MFFEDIMAFQAVVEVKGLEEDGVIVGSCAVELIILRGDCIT
jgi:hypothetical protein